MIANLRLSYIFNSSASSSLNITCIIPLLTRQVSAAQALRHHQNSFLIAKMGQKTVFITGCSEGGIGDALAKTFHKKGLRVFASARNTAKIQHLKDMGIEIVQLDVTNEESIKKAVSTVKASTGGILDVLVNNSGIGKSHTFKKSHQIFFFLQVLTV